jgi:hypothetical protein
LYDDSLLFPSEIHDQPPIGVISLSDKDVRRKITGNFIWLPGNKKDQIYNQDSIFTGNDSKASIQLTDGSMIHLKENSLVNLNLKNGQMQLDLKFGRFVGSSDVPLHIKTGNDEYTIQGTDSKVEIQRTHTGKLDMKVLSGNAEVTGKAGKQKLKSNESLSLSKNSMKKNQDEAKIRLLTEDDFHINRSSDKIPISFEWEGRGPLTQYQIEIAKTEDFKKVLSQRSTADQKISIKDSLQEGTYFWRVKGLDSLHKTLVTSPKHKFYISYMAAPKITTPEAQSTIKIKALNTDEGLLAVTQISWEADARLVSFQWQLGKTAEFVEILSEKTLNEKTLTTPNLRQNTYFTRVRGFDKDKRPSQWSQVHAFNFEIRPEEKPPAPRLAEKHLHFSIPKLEGRAPSADTSPQMAWSKVDAAKIYHWEIAKNARFVGAQTTDTPKTTATWTQYKPGKYYFRVFAQSELGQNSEASETGVLEVYDDAPVLNPIPLIFVYETNILAEAPPQTARIAWTPTPAAKSYLVQFDKTEDFQNPVQLEVNTTESALSLPQPGKYFVRVKALNESSQDMSPFSNIQVAKYVFKKILKAPVLIEPYDKTTIFLQKDMEPFIWLEWGVVPDAASYNLEISTTADFAQKVISKTVTNTRFLVKEKLPYGNIFWRIKAVSEDPSISGDWSTRQFMIYHQRNNGF